MGLQTPNRPGFGSRPLAPGLNAGGALRRVPGRVLTPGGGAGTIFGGRRTGPFSGVVSQPTGPGSSPINPADLNLPGRGPSPVPRGPGSSPIDTPNPQIPAKPVPRGPGNVNITVTTPGGPTHGGPVGPEDNFYGKPQGPSGPDGGPFRTPPIQPTMAPPAPQPTPPRVPPPAPPPGLNPFIQGNLPQQGTSNLGLWNNPFWNVGLDRLFNRGF